MRNVARIRAWRVRLLIFAGAIGWVAFLASVVGHIHAGWTADDPPIYWLYDWHVHYLGAIDFVERDLYRHGLSLPSWSLPSSVFNLPPASAAIAVPLLPLGRELGGLVWLLIGMACLVGSALLAVRVFGLSHGWAWVGLAFFGYTGVYFFVGHVVLGNVNHIMLALLTGFAWAHLNGRVRLAGGLLGTAIAIKAWPITLLVLVARERRWKEIRWAVGLVLAQAVVILVWLGPDVLPAMAESLRVDLPLDPDAAFMWTTWLRQIVGVPPWGAPVLAAVLLLLPMRGAVGIGVGILAGLALINNVWNHYLPTVGLALLCVGVVVVPRLWSGMQALGTRHGSEHSGSNGLVQSDDAVDWPSSFEPEHGKS